MGLWYLWAAERRGDEYVIQVAPLLLEIVGADGLAQGSARGGKRFVQRRGKTPEDGLGKGGIEVTHHDDVGLGRNDLYAVYDGAEGSCGQFAMSGTSEKSACLAGQMTYHYVQGIAGSQLTFCIEQVACGRHPVLNGWYTYCVVLSQCKEAGMIEQGYVHSSSVWAVCHDVLVACSPEGTSLCKIAKYRVVFHLAEAHQGWRSHCVAHVDDGLAHLVQLPPVAICCPVVAAFRQEILVVVTFVVLRVKHILHVPLHDPERALCSRAYADHAER